MPIRFYNRPPESLRSISLEVGQKNLKPVPTRGFFFVVRNTQKPPNDFSRLSVWHRCLPRYQENATITVWSEFLPSPFVYLNPSSTTISDTVRIIEIPHPKRGFLFGQPLDIVRDIWLAFGGDLISRNSDIGKGLTQKQRPDE